MFPQFIIFWSECCFHKLWPNYFSKADLSNMKYEGMFGEQEKKPRKYCEENGINKINVLTHYAQSSNKCFTVTAHLVSYVTHLITLSSEPFKKKKKT